MFFLLKCWRQESFEDIDGLFNAKAPIGRWCTGTIHESVTTLLDFLDLTFSEVLMLVVRFELEIFDNMHAEDFTNCFTDLGS